MLLPKLISDVWVLVLINAALVPLAIAGESMKRHRKLGSALQWAPWVFPVLCIAAFMTANRLDRKHAERLLTWPATQSGDTCAAGPRALRTITKVQLDILR